MQENRRVFSMSVFAFAMSAYLTLNVHAETVIKSPNDISCQEYLKLQTNEASLPGLFNENNLRGAVYQAWGVGYIQSRDPTIFPGLVQQRGKILTKDEEFGTYIGIISGLYDNLCKRMGDTKLEALTKLLVERLPETLK